MFLQQLGIKDNPIIFDIGCNNAVELDVFFAVFKNPTIFCFEPDPRAIQRFKEKNKGKREENIFLIEKAVGDIDGTIPFFQSDGTLYNVPNWDQSGSIKQPLENEIHKIWPDLEFKQNPTKVQSIRLDTFCQQNNIAEIDLIWMDVQGAELEALSGATNILKNTKYIYTECPIVKMYESDSNIENILNMLPNFSKIFEKIKQNKVEKDILLRNNKV